MFSLFTEREFIVRMLKYGFILNVALKIQKKEIIAAVTTEKLQLSFLYEANM